MNNTVFALMNAKIQGEIRNNANRVANCETNNIGKAVTASMDVISVIEELDAKGLLSQLPEELEITARARMENKHLSLSQLAATITPPITKSGLSHRLKKIAEIADDIIKKKTNSFIGVGKFDSSINALSLTSTSSDFNTAAATHLVATISNINAPILLVIKKNKSILEFIKN